MGLLLSIDDARPTDFLFGGTMVSSNVDFKGQFYRFFFLKKRESIIYIIFFLKKCAANGQKGKDLIGSLLEAQLL